MATEGPQVKQTIQAASDFRVVGALYKVVNGTGDFCAANDGYAVGVALSKPNSGQHLSVGVSGVFKAYIGAAVNSVGAPLAMAASGWLSVAVSGNVACGRALQTGASGGLIRCHLDFANKVLAT